MSLNGREEPLHVYGPEGTADDVKSMLDLGYFKSGFEVIAEDLEAGSELDFGKYSVRCVRADHTIPSLAYALEEKPRPGKFDLRKAKKLGIPEGPLYGRLQEGRAVTVGGKRIEPEAVLGPSRPGRKIVYTGDTKPSKEIVKLSSGADVLIHDCTLDSTHASLASDFGHSTAAGAAGVAKRSGVGILFLVHFSPRYESGEILEKEARGIFKNSRAAEDLEEYAVRFRD
jgi:ribonuclease Z